MKQLRASNSELTVDQANEIIKSGGRIYNIDRIKVPFGKTLMAEATYLGIARFSEIDEERNKDGIPFNAVIYYEYSSN